MQKQTLKKYFSYLSSGESVNKNEDKNNLLIVYVGHNSLMEVSSWHFKKPNPSQDIDTSVLACQSKSYFKKILGNKKINQILMTKTNMAPEGYLVESLLDAYFSKKSRDLIKKEVVGSYAKYQKISQKAAGSVFH